MTDHEALALDLSESIELLEAVKVLDQEAIKRRYYVFRMKGQGHSSVEIGDHLGISASSVNRILIEMILKMRTKYKLHLSAKYMSAVVDGINDNNHIRANNPRLENIYGLIKKGSLSEKQRQHILKLLDF